MKTFRHPLSVKVSRRGFALVITSMLMVLMTVLVVSILSLAAVTLRGSTADQWRAEAKANARLALMLAIGDLQREIGPDQRITANARVLDTAANPQWLGTWNAWDQWLNADGIRETYVAGRTSRFRRWLVSQPDPAALSNAGAASQVVADAARMTAPAGDVAAVEAPKVPVENGAFAWWVAGENQKARAADSESRGSSFAQLAGRSMWPGDGIEWLDGLDKLEAPAEVLAKAISLPSLAVSNGDRAVRDRVNGHFHDLTTDSLGLLANVRHGGMKKDLNLLLERRSLPSEFGTFGASKPGGSVVSIRDEEEELPGAFFGNKNPNFPSWYKLRQYYSLYKAEGDETAQDCIPLPFKRGLWGNGSPNANFHWDRGNFDQFGWARTPILSRLMMVFSTRRTASRTPGKYDYKLGVNPVVVLWNPYNVTLHSGRQFIEIGPGSLEYKAYVNGRQTFDWKKVRLSNRADGQGTFKVRVYPMEGPGPAFYEKPIILKPGETRIYSARSGFIQAENQYHVELYPGYQPPEADGGFDVPIDGFANIDGNARVELAMRIGDSRSENDGVHQIYYVARNGQTGDQQRYSEMAGNPIEDGKPMPVVEDSPGQRVVFPSSTQRVPFASFQFVLKSGEDLRNPGAYGEQDYRCKNFIHANPVNQRAAYGEATDRMRGLSQYHVYVEQGSGNALNPDFDPSNNRAYLGSAISLGNSTWPGQSSVVTTELPAVPVTSIASLMHFKLNPGETSFASECHGWDVSVNQALGIGNSFAHPLIPATGVYQDVPDLAARGGSQWLEFKLARDCYDHAFLNNDALWDDWFCSTITPQSRGVFAESRNLNEVLHDFLSGDEPLPNGHLRPWAGGLDESALRDVFADGNDPADEAWRKASSHLVLDGAFNINSTSVAAWEAFLGGLKDEELLYLDAESGRVRSAKVADDRVVFSRFSLPCSPEEGRDAGDRASWLGVRLLTEDQIDRLARECVRQVQLRGPFLNLADFVNRRLQDGEQGVSGALQAAIDWDESSPDPSSIFPQDRYGREFAFTGSFTAELFFKTVDPETGLSSDESGSGNMQLLLNAEHDMKFALIVNENTPGGIRFAINDSKGTIPLCDIAERNYADGTWHYVQATYDASLGGKGALKLVIRNEDGSIDVSSVDLGSTYPNFVSLSPAFNNLFVGRNRYAANEDHRNFNGLIEEIQITRGVVSASEQLGNLSNLATYASAVSVYPMPADGGSVTGSGIFDNGATVAVAATPKPGYVFAGWSGDFNGQAASFTTAPLAGDRSSVATFGPDNSDTDNDGLSAYEEIVLNGTNSAVADTDGDGLRDGDEVETIGSNPRSNDSALVSYLGAAGGGMGTSVMRDPGTGNFYLSLDLTQSIDLDDWDDLPVSSGDITVSGGNILVELPEPPSPSAFWRFTGSQGTAP